jgi:hypothetical protein
VTDPPFSIGLRLYVVVVRESPLPPGGLLGLAPVATAEPSSAIFASNELPPPGAADDVLRRTFASHPMVNTSRDPGETASQASRTQQAFVIAQVVLQPELAPIPPGGEFPNITEELLSDPIVVHRAPVSGNLWAQDESSAAHGLLREIIQALPRELWHPDA